MNKKILAAICTATIILSTGVTAFAEPAGTLSMSTPAQAPAKTEPALTISQLPQEFLDQFSAQLSQIFSQVLPENPMELLAKESGFTAQIISLDAESKDNTRFTYELQDISLKEFAAITKKYNANASKEVPAHNDTWFYYWIKTPGSNMSKEYKICTKCNQWIATGRSKIVRGNAANSVPMTPLTPATPATPTTPTTPSQEATEHIVVADAARFMGTVEDFAVNDKGETVLMMRRALGSNYQKNLKVSLTKNTRFSFSKDNLGNGAFLEIYYSGKPDANGMVDAIAINNLGTEDLTNYNGKLISVTPDANKKDCGQLLLEPINGNAMPFVFNYSPETKFAIDLNKLTKGTQLHVIHSPASTRSIPPQSAAFEISAYSAPEVGEVPTPALS